MANFLRLFAVLYLGTGVLAAQATATAKLEINQIMQGEDFVGASPRSVRWSGDGERIYFDWRGPDSTEKKRGTYIISRDGSGLRRLTKEEEKEAWPQSGDWDRQRQRFLFIREGDVFLWQDSGTRRLTQTQAAESDARFTHDEQAVHWTEGNNLYLFPLQGGELRQLTDFRQGSKPSKKDPTPNQKFLEEQQEKLFEQFSGDKKEEREEREKEQEERSARAFYIGSGESVSRLRPGPDLKTVSFLWNKDASGAKRTNVPDYVTVDGFSRDLTARPKVGSERDQTKLGLYKVDSGEVTWVEATEDSAMVAGPVFNERGDRAALLVVSQDYKYRRLMTLDMATGATSVVDELHDEAWVGGPEAFVFGWMPEGDRLYFVSERDGFAHLYVVGHDGEGLGALTSGEWEVIDVRMSNDKEHWFLTTSEVHPGERHLYRMPIEGGARERLTREEGRHDATLSPDESHVAILYSNANTPPELYVEGLASGGQRKKLTQSTTPEFRAYSWRRPELIRFPARDGARPWARFYKPDVPAAGRPAVIFVHGAGYLQNVHKWWSSYYREYMFHHVLVENGYHVLDIDYRGSAGYGRDWRTAIYRHMGGKDLTDQVDGAKWLIEEHDIDPKRIGIYGGSYGGFITLMAMFTEPEVFRAGAS